MYNFYSVHWTRTHYDSLKFTANICCEQMFYCCTTAETLCTFQIPVILLSLTFILMVSGRHSGFPLHTPLHMHLISCHMLSKVTRTLYFHFTPHMFKDTWEDKISSDGNETKLQIMW